MYILFNTVLMVDLNGHFFCLPKMKIKINVFYDFNVKIVIRLRSLIYNSLRS